jgi:Zn-dependent oligopeptidase
LSKISVYEFPLWAQKGGRPWSEEVSLYRVTDLEGKLKGHVYLDPYIR